MEFNHPEIHNDRIVVTWQTRDCYQEVVFAGRLDYGTIKTVKQRTAEVPLETQGYILDMSQILNIDSTGFGFLVNFARRVNAEVIHPIVIIVTDEVIRDLFQIAKLDMIFNLVDSLPAALDFLAQQDTTKVKLLDTY